MEDERKKSAMHFGTSIEPSVESQNLAVFADERFFGEILKIINKNEIQCPNKTTMDDLELFTRCLYVCCYYGFSPDTLWQDKIGFPYFQVAVDNLGGISKFKHIINCLKSPKMKTDLSWDNYFDECPSVRQIEKVISENCSEVLNHVEIRNSTIDNDKLRFHSKQWETHGFTKK